MQSLCTRRKGFLLRQPNPVPFAVHIEIEAPTHLAHQRMVAKFVRNYMVRLEFTLSARRRTHVLAQLGARRFTFEVADSCTAARGRLQRARRILGASDSAR